MLSKFTLVRAVSFGLLFLIHASCEQEDHTIHVSGTVLQKGTGTPIAGIGVTLRYGAASYGAYPVASSMLTDSSGYFALFYDPKDDNSTNFVTMTINDDPYVASYSVTTFSVHYGEHWEKAFYLDKK